MSQSLSLIITNNSKGDKIAVLFDLSVSYADHKAECAQLAPSLFSSILGSVDKVNGKVVSAEDAEQAVNKVVEAVNNEADTGVASWAVSVGGGIIRHAKKGTEYLQGRAVASIVIEEATDKKVSKPRGSRNGATLANKEIAKCLPKWRMVSLASATRYDGAEAQEMFQKL